MVAWPRVNDGSVAIDAPAGVELAAHHAPIEGGMIVGHGGPALELYIGLLPSQAHRLAMQGISEPPRSVSN